jgi:hypothetical protein
LLYWSGPPGLLIVENWIPLKPVTKGVTSSTFKLSHLNILNQTKLAIFI